MPDYYEILMLQPKATTAEVEASFRRVVARYRPTLTVEQLFTDPRFLLRMNAYLTLNSPLRSQYDAQRKQESGNARKGAELEEAQEAPPPPRPLDEYSRRDLQMLMARIAAWREEPVEAIHLLRVLLQREGEFAPGWALLAEIYFSLDRLEEGIHALQRAVQADGQNTAYAARLQHAEEALAGKVALKVALSPEEELLREERRKRWLIAGVIMLAGLAAFVYAVLPPYRPFPEAFYVPWLMVGKLALALCLLFIGAGYGRLLVPFERALLWSAMPAGDRGRIRSYPYGLLLFVTAVPSLWLAVITWVIIALSEEEWPPSPTIMLGACALLTAGLAVLMYFTCGQWLGTALVGGNLLAIAAMLGWWLGSVNVGGHD